MGNEKKTTSITFRVTPDVKAALQEYADSRRWTVSQTVDFIIEQWLERESDREAEPPKPRKRRQQ